MEEDSRGVSHRQVVLEVSVTITIELKELISRHGYRAFFLCQFRIGSWLQQAVFGLLNPPGIHWNFYVLVTTSKVKKMQYQTYVGVQHLIYLILLKLCSI